MWTDCAPVDVVTVIVVSLTLAIVPRTGVIAAPEAVAGALAAAGAGAEAESFGDASRLLHDADASSVAAARDTAHESIEAWASLV